MQRPPLLKLLPPANARLPTRNDVVLCRLRLTTSFDAFPVPTAPSAARHVQELDVIDDRSSTPLRECWVKILRRMWISFTMVVKLAYFTVTPKPGECTNEKEQNKQT